MIRDLDADGNLATRGGDAQERYRNDSVWHALDDFKKSVARELQIGPELFGERRRNDEFHHRIRVELRRLVKKGIVSAWNSSDWHLAFRLTKPGSHSVLRIEPLVLVRTPPTYGDKWPIKFGEEEDMKRVFVSILEHGNKDNTYKFALAKILLDYCRNNTSGTISYDYLAHKFLEHYWYQEYKYRMKQDFKATRRPMVINVLRGVFGDNPRADFGRLDEDDIRKAKEKILKAVFGHARNKTSLVVPRFQNIPGRDGGWEEYGIFYSYDDDEQVIRLRPEAVDFFKRNNPILSRAVVAKWAGFLERINGSMPYLVSKIEVPGMERGSMTVYRRMLSRYADCCFYCNKRLQDNETHVDHFIPWSYIFSNDPWNLVLACNVCNYKKSNRLPDDEFKCNLIVRNEEYYDKAREFRESLNTLGLGDKWKHEIENHYVTCLSYGFGKVSLR